MELQKLRRENVRLTEQLRKAAIVIDVQKSGRAVGLAPTDGGPGGNTLIDAVIVLAATFGVVAACDCLAAIQATLLDKCRSLCSTRTMYGILDAEGESRERRDQLLHPAYQKH